MASMNFDEDGLLEEPCLSCDKAYVEDIWHEWCCDEKECPYDDGERFKEYIKELPSVTSTQKWIPCSEGLLPKEGECVLVCTEDGEIEKAYHTIQEWCEDGEIEWRVFETLGYSYTLDDDEVVAWMPLPKPYTESE